MLRRIGVDADAVTSASDGYKVAITIPINHYGGEAHAYDYITLYGYHPRSQQGAINSLRSACQELYAGLGEVLEDKS